MKFYFSYVIGSKDKYNLEKIILEEGDNRSEVVIPDSYNGKPITQISDDILYEFGSELKTVVFGDNLSLLPITLFYESSGLEKIYLGKKIGIIHSELEWCPNLKDVYFNGTQEEWEALSEYGTPQRFENANCTVHFGTIYDKVQLKQDDKPIYPFTHWDCVKGVPNDIGVQADYGENDNTSKSHILNREFYRIHPYDGVLTVDEYTGNEVCTNTCTDIPHLESDYWLRFIKIADLKTDHKSVIKLLSRCEIKSGNVLEYGSDKKYSSDYSIAKIASEITVIAVNSALSLQYDIIENYSSCIIDFPEPGLYFVETRDSESLNYYPTKLYFDQFVKKIDADFIPENYVTDNDIPTKLSDLEGDEDHRTVTDNEKKAWNKKSDFSGKYEDLDGLPEIPTTEGLATEDFVVEKVDKATTFEEIDLPENFEGYTDVINLTEPVGFDWLKLKMWSESDGLTIPESNSPYDFDFSKIKEMEKVRLCSVPAKIDLETIDRNMVSAVFIEVHKDNESGIFGFQIMKLDSFLRIVMNAEGIPDMYYLRQGDSLDSIADFRAPSEGWYRADVSNGTARMATDADLSLFAGEYHVKIIDWGSFCKDQAAEMGVTEISPQKVIDLFLNELISYPKGIYKSKLLISKVPEKGVDYFTEEDKAELVNSVLEALPKWEGGSY